MRIRIGSALLAAVLCAVLASRARAGDVFVVSPGGPYATVQAAIDAAGDYDTVLVKYAHVPPNWYPGFTINGKSIAVVGETSFGPTLTPIVGGEVRVQAVSSGKLAVIAALDVRAVSAAAYALRLLGNGGSVRIERCTMSGLSSDCTVDSGPCAWVGTDDDPQFVATTLLGGEPSCEWPPGVKPGKTALFSRSPMLKVFGGSLLGGDGSSVFEDDAWPGGGGGRGVEVPDGVTLLVGTTVRGGKGGNGDYESHFDCSAGGAGGAGGHGIFIGSSPPSTATPDVRTIGSVVAGGAGGVGGGSKCGPNGPNGPPGLAAFVSNGTYTPLPGIARYFDSSPLVREDGTASLVFRGAAGDRVYITTEEISSQSPLVVGTNAHLPATAHTKPTGALLGTIGPSGSLTTPLPLDPLAPGVASQWLRIKSLFVDSTGVRHTGNEFVLIVLDESF